MYILNADGAICKNKDKKDIDKKFLIDISTKMKGPVYTISDNLPTDTLSSFKIGLELIYSVEDCPYSDITNIHYQIEINSIEKFFSIYPLIQQMIVYNFYCDNFDIISKRISITRIEIESTKLGIIIEEYDDDTVIKKAFARIGMVTIVHKIMLNKFLILTKDNRWYISKEIPSSFHRIGIPIIGTESLYLLSKKQYKRLLKIVELDITMGYNEEETGEIDYSTDYYDFSILEMNHIVCHKLESILETCLFFPQMISMEKAVYGKVSEINISVILDSDASYTIHINEKEAERSIDLFNILNKLVELDNTLII